VNDKDVKPWKVALTTQVKSRNTTFRGAGKSIKMSSFRGFPIEADKNTIKDILANPMVDYVEKEQAYKALYLDYKPVIEDKEQHHSSKNDKRFYVTQPGSTWGLARISHRSTTATDYTYDVTGGLGTRVYVIDTGVFTGHTEFGGRAVWGANFIAGSPNADENGHGTHCAGTIGGSTYGVAKQATIVAVKVLNSLGSGTTSGVVQGIQWAVNDAVASGANRSVISMSLGGPPSSSLNAAVTAAITAGITVVVAGGNSGADASNYSPANVPSAITVGAIDNTDTKPSWSNWGSTIDLFAPGLSIRSAWITSLTASAYLSGTSMACPHVAGLAAYLIAKEGPTTTPAILTSKIVNLANGQTVGAAGAGSPNLIAYNGYGL